MELSLPHKKLSAELIPSSKPIWRFGFYHQPRDDPCTDTAKIAEGTNPHNDTIQRTDFRFIHMHHDGAVMLATKRTRQT